MRFLVALFAIALAGGCQTGSAEKDEPAQEKKDKSSKKKKKGGKKKKGKKGSKKKKAKKKKVASKGEETSKPVAPPPAVPTAKPVVPASGSGEIRATVNFTGLALRMKVPKKRSQADHCKDKQVPHNAVVEKSGKLADVWIGLSDGQVTGQPKGTPRVAFQDCTLSPRVVGALRGQDVSWENADGTMHNFHIKKDDKSILNIAVPKGAPAAKYGMGLLGIHRVTCDVHPWERAFLVVSDNPHFGVTNDKGTVTISGAPEGSFRVTAWHSIYGKKEQTVTIQGTVDVSFSYDGTESPPPENKGELDGLF